MPPKKTAKTTTATTSTNKGAQTTGQTTGQANLCAVELPPSPTPGSMGLQADSDNAPPTNLATAINLLAKNLSSPKKSSTWTKVHKLDVFDGSDTCKLQPFLAQCTLNFWDHPDAFASDSAKVTFTLSYLQGTTLDWFKPSLTSSDSPP